MSAPLQFGRDGMIELDPPVSLPPVLDVLIVGGGPFGTAAAFRAKELNLAALVIDHDDLMKRIRDYAKDKLILPDFGGGDRMEFPKAGPLIDALHFEPIDKDAMCVHWKSLYREHRVPAQVGIELTGLDHSGGNWRAVAWNHNLKTEQVYEARHVVLAFGRGVPRRFDIPGDVSGLAFGLNDAQRYVGEPALVIGGGTSAGEAVIAISNAKAQANDPSGVYWSYRGDKMPKVSKALADVFFDAFMGNGNIRYLPGSEPVAIVDADGHQMLSLRTSRVAQSGRPTETTQLEFKKVACIACIGEDVPSALLARLGVPLVAGGEANKERPVVSPLLETRQPNVYLAGDVLSPAYFETTDFSIDPSQYVEIKRRGNVKAAMRDGVLVAEVIAQKLAGKREINVTIQFAERAKAPVTPSREEAHRATCSLVSVLAGNVEAQDFPLKHEGITTIGRRNADVNFPDDANLDELQATITVENERYLVKDAGRPGGVLLQPKVDRAIALTKGDAIRVGGQWLVMTLLQQQPAVAHHDSTGKRLATYPLKDGTTVLGRQSPDITIAPGDGMLSRRHLAFVRSGNDVAAKDLGSANGTQFSLARALPLAEGDRLLMGQQVLLFRDERVTKKPAREVSLLTVPPPATPKPPAAPAAGGGPTVTLDGQTFACPAGQTVCDAAAKAGVKLEADCHQGVCGMDPIKIVSGLEHLNPINRSERSTLEDLCDLKPGQYRLACMARINGPVVVEKVKT
jgi:thioredoxin reductase/ferredoxin